ncbi:unnamed protein product [Orchesella dallaii]|uniref:Uncharacterized protein n=1 Tax=Orchesella dallaii TaxID=48710 RepID=A0ABP1QJA1_9HEXA
MEDHSWICDRPQYYFGVAQYFTVFPPRNEKGNGTAFAGTYSFTALMKNACLDLPNTLNCRLVNTTTKSTVDKTFKAIRIKKRPRGCNSSFFPPSPYTLPTYLNLEPFIRHFESLPTLTGNPFITDCLNLSVVSSLCYERVLEAVTRFGHLMKELELTMDRIYHPTTLMNRLIRFLTCVPNLERLQFRFAGFPERIEIDVIDANHGMTTTDLGILYPVPAAATFPTLPRLSELEFIQMDRESESGVHRYPPFYSIKAAAREILTAYGSQLSVFKCGYELFEMDIPADFFTQQLSTLSELTIAGFENGDQFNSLARLADVQLPKLTRLSLEIMGENLESSFWELLNNLRNSLEELYVWRRKADMPFEILHFDDFAPLPPVMVLPKLKLLTLEPPDLNLNMDGTFWPELQPRLTNLECLEFRVRNSLNSPKIESLPEIQVQNHFFGNFPILNQFIWKVRREDCVNTTVITRRDLKEGEQRVVSERIPYIQQWPRRLP